MQNFFLLLLLSSMSRSQWWLIWFKYDSFYYIFWTVDSLATKLGLMIHHRMPEYPVVKVGLLHSESRSQQRIKMLMFVQMISSKPPSILFPNFVLWCIIMQELLWSKYDSVCCIFWIADSFAAKLCLIVHYHKPECFMEKLDCCVQGQGHSKISKCHWWYFLKCWTFYYQTLYGNATLWARLSLKKIVFVFFLSSRSSSQLQII